MALSKQQSGNDELMMTYETFVKGATKLHFSSAAAGQTIPVHSEIELHFMIIMFLGDGVQHNVS